MSVFKASDDQVEHRPVVFARLVLRHVPLERRAVHRGLGDFEPGVEPDRSLFDVADRVSDTRRAWCGRRCRGRGGAIWRRRAPRRARSAAVQAKPSGRDAAGLLAEQAVEDVAGVVLGRQGDAVPGEGQGGRVVRLPGARTDREFQRGEPRVKGCDVTSAISWSHEIVLWYCRALWASILAPVSQVSAQTWAWPRPLGWCRPLKTVKSSRSFSSGASDGESS